MKQYTLLTASGINKLLKTASDGSKIALKEVVVSDYDGELSEQTASIPNEKYRGAINAITIDENDNNILDVDAIIPPEVGGFYIKTAGIYCDDGSLFAVARLADTYKPLLNEGSSKDITLNFKLQIANASESIILKVDNNIVLATRKWCEKMFLKLKDKIDAYNKQESDNKFVAKTDIATEDSAGIFKVTNEITGSRSDVVVTEKAVANNALSFEPYNKVEVDVFDFLGIGNTVNTKNILGDNSCVSLYTFENDSEGAVLTKAGYSNQAKFGTRALRFNQVAGETVKLKDSDKIAFKNDFTVTLWFNYDSTANAAVHKDHRIFSIQFFIDLSVSSIVNGIGCGVGNNGRWTVARAEKPFTTFANYKTDDWNFAVIKRTGAKVEFFMNDEKIDEIDNFTTDGSLATNAIELGLGAQPFKGGIDQVRIFNKALSDREIFNVKNEASSAGSTTLALQGTVYLSDKSLVPGRYLNTAKAIEAKLTKAQQKANGTYFIKVKQDNSLELVDIRPEFHHKSTTAEYYLDGAWYDKTGIRLQPQTYLPYSVTVTSKSITSVNFENIYPSSKELGVGQRWIDERANRQNNFTYKNETGRSIQISCYINTVPIQTSQDGINWVSHPAASTAGECEIIIPAGYFYKTANVGPQWLELK